jgi:ATP/maltotriose-dependent transcriptional regulator MalT
MARLYPLLLQDALGRGDLFAATNLRSRVSSLVHLMADDVAQARAELRQSMEEWRNQGVHLQHYFALSAEVDIGLYAGTAAEIWRQIEASWPEISDSFLNRLQGIWITLLHLHGRCALALAAAPGTDPAERLRLVRLAEQDAAGIERENMAWSNPQALLVRAGVAACRGDLPEAIQILERAEADFRSADMGMYAAVAQRRRGQLLGAAGTATLRAADDWLERQNVIKPARLTAMYVTGFLD